MPGVAIVGDRVIKWIKSEGCSCPFGKIQLLQMVALRIQAFLFIYYRPFKVVPGNSAHLLCFAKSEKMIAKTVMMVRFLMAKIAETTLLITMMKRVTPSRL